MVTTVKELMVGKKTPVIDSLGSSLKNVFKKGQKNGKGEK